MRQLMVLSYLGGAEVAYGLEVIRDLKMCSGVLYPVARKLCRDGLLDEEREEIEEWREGLLLAHASRS